MCDVNIESMNKIIESLEAKVDETKQSIQSLTELVANMHIDLYSHINGSADQSDPVDYDDSLIK